MGLRVRELFGELGLECFPKTSGSKGLQVYVPLNAEVTYERTKPFARAVAQALERAEPEPGGLADAKKLRKGKVLRRLEPERPHKTTVAVYSLRAASGRRSPPRSTGRRSRAPPTGRSGAAQLRGVRGARAGRGPRRPVRARARAGAGAAGLARTASGRSERLADDRPAAGASASSRRRTGVV